MKKKILDTLRSGFSQFVLFEWFEVFLIASGILTGMIASRYITADNGGYLLESTESYIAQIRSADAPIKAGFIPILFGNSKYYLLIVFFAYSAFGTYMIPAILAMKGFFLSFTVCAYIRILGTHGAVLAILGFGMQNILIIPALLYIGYESYKASAALMGAITQSSLQRTTLPGKEYLFKCMVFSAFPICAALLEYTAVPFIVYRFFSA